MDSYKKIAYGYVLTIDETARKDYNNIDKSVIYNERVNTSSRGRAFRANGCWFLAAVRRTAFDNVMQRGFLIRQNVFRFTSETYNKLFESAYLNIMPDDLFDALRFGKQNIEHTYTDIYINKITKTTLYVNRADNLIIDINKDDTSNRIPCLSCQQNRKNHKMVIKTGYVIIEKGSGNSDGSSDDEDPPPDCYPEDFDPEQNGYVWKGKGTPESNQGNWVNPENGTWIHNDLDHPPPIGPHWDYKSKGMSEKVRVGIC